MCSVLEENELPEIVRDDNYDFNFQVNELVNASLSPL